MVLISSVIILGSFTLGFVENGVLEVSPTTDLEYGLSMTITPPFYPVGTLLTPTGTHSAVAQPAGDHSSISITATLPPIICQTPPGWITIIVQIGDTLPDLAQQYGLTPEELAKANCLLVNTLTPGTILDVPNVTVANEERQVVRADQCGPPAGWTVYIVQPGDSLYTLAVYLGVTVRQLQFANCLGQSTLIIAGQILYVPFYIPPRIPTLTPTWSGYATARPTMDITLAFTPTQSLTATPRIITDTPRPQPPTLTDTATLPPTVPPTATPTDTLPPSPTDTEPPATATPTIVPTDTPWPTATATVVPTNTYIPLPSVVWTRPPTQTTQPPVGP